MSILKNIFFPKVCYACGGNLSRGTAHICLKCRQDIPKTHLYVTKSNPIDKLFWGRVEMEKATSFTRFQKDGKIQKVIHQLKYKGKKKIGLSLGKWAAAELKEYGFFEGIDLIVPIPIHKEKLASRGYNQSFFIAEGISNVSKIPVNTKLVYKSLHTESQTNKRKFQRWDNVRSSFQLNPKLKNSMENKHILLVDDVLTTGATVEACVKVLKNIPKLKLSLLTIACTY